MNKILKIAAAATLLSTSYGVAAEGSPIAAENFSATLTFSTDYTFRGTTFSTGEPVVQGSFDWGYGPWFAGAWATSQTANDPGPDGTETGTATTEIDYYFGWADAINGVDLMVMPLFYTFPGQDQDRDDFTFELWTSVGYGFANAPGAPYVGFEFNWSPEYFENGDDSFYYRGSVAFSLPNGVGIDGGYGYTDIGDTNDFFGDDYGHWDIGATYSFAGFDFDLRYHDTSSSDENALNTFFPTTNGFALDSEIVFSVSRSF